MKSWRCTLLLLSSLLTANAVHAQTLVNPSFEDDHGFFGVARGWTKFGGNKWEAVWESARMFTQGVSQLQPAGAGVYQSFAVTPRTTYRVVVNAKVTAAGYEAALGVDAGGGADPTLATFTAGAGSNAWTPLTFTFLATGPRATIFLRGRKVQGVLDGWVQFDGVSIIATAGSGNTPPVAAATATPATGPAPLSVQLDARASSDTDGDPLTYQWNFGDGTPPGAGPTASHSFSADGLYQVMLTVSDGKGGNANATVAVTVGAVQNRIVNGDFSQGLTGWLRWSERAALNLAMDAGQLRVSGANHNGGVYQRFSTGGQGSRVEISGLWASDPTVARQQWSEVLVINGPRLPIDFQDVNAGQSDVIVIYKNDTFATPGGWSGPMSATSPVAKVGAFVAADSVATIVLKSGNVGGTITGTRFDDVVVLSTVTSPTNHPPQALATADPASGNAPLNVQFDGARSTDPDGDVLAFDWDFGDGSPRSSVARVQHSYTAAGNYQARLTVTDGRGGSHSVAVPISVSAQPSGPDVAVNGGFEQGFVDGLATGWRTWSSIGSGYWKQSSRLGRIGSGSYASGTAVFNAVNRLHPKVVLLEGNAFGMAPAIRAALPDALIVGRLFIDPRVGEYLSNPELFGARHAEDCFNQNRPEIDAWQGFNEPFLNDAENAKKVARFEKAFSDRLHELGLKSVVFNIAVGNPGDMSIMLLPEIVATLASADYVGYHAYGGIHDQLMVGPESPYFAHRWRFYAQMYKERGYRMPPVIYTEATTFYAWKQGHTPPGYTPFQPAQIRDDLIAFERESRQDPWSVGMTLFLIGASSAQWEGWEVANEPIIYQGAGDHNWSNPADAKSGVSSQQFGAQGAFRGGIVQVVNLQAGATYEITTSMKYETYGPRRKVAYRVGYDPSGQATDPDAPILVWSDDLVAAEKRETDMWYTGRHRFTATASQASIWIAAAQDDGYDPFRVSVDDLKIEPATTSTPAVDTDPGTVWNVEPMDEFSGDVVRGWTPWHEGNGEFEWHGFAGETNGAQEVKKRDVRIGIYRENRGFLTGDRYRMKLRARFHIGSGTPRVSIGVHPTGGTDLAGVVWGEETRLVSKGVWTDVLDEFVAAGAKATVFLRVDFTGVLDGGVSLDNLSLERLTPHPPLPWMADGSPPVEPSFIYGMHDAGAEHLFNQKTRKGWVVHAIGIGDDPTDQSGRRFSEWVDGHGVIVRISHGFGDTLPDPKRFPQFAQRCANFVKNSVGAGIWSIANEPGLERAGDVPITPEIYANAFIQCRNAIKAVRPKAQVITAGMVQGSLEFFERTMQLLEGKTDGIAIHSYTNANFFNEAAFNLYRGMMQKIPASMRNLPVYMTEAGSGATGPYPDQNNHFIDKLFNNVHQWNHTTGNQPIRSVNFYRWRSFDQWGIEAKPGMIADFASALDPSIRGDDRLVHRTAASIQARGAPATGSSWGVRKDVSACAPAAPPPTCRRSRLNTSDSNARAASSTLKDERSDALALVSSCC